MLPLLAPPYATLMHLRRRGCVGLNDTLLLVSPCAQTMLLSEQQDAMFPSFSVLLLLFSQGGRG